MNFTIRYASEFFEDLQQGVDWYNDQQTGLGARFFKAVKDRIATVKMNPNGVAIRYKNVRCAKLKKFPYMIHFRILQEHNIIEIIAVYSTHRNPEIWKTRS
jgi:mRNA-degrading endonuclease RelE of RelBE toxin-antitoxin system